MNLKLILELHIKYLKGEEGGQRADLRNANLRNADLEGANLRNADLEGADLRNADLEGADLRNANLRNADLEGADLEGADLEGTTLPDFRLIPEEGAFIAYKKVLTLGGIEVILKLAVKGENAICSLVGRKCRAVEVKVLEAIESKELVFKSKHDHNFEYRIGEIKRENDWNNDIRVECEAGIHFFVTKKEAEEY